MNSLHLNDFPISANLRITDLNRDPAVTYDREAINKRIDATARGLSNLGLPVSSRIAIIGTGTFNFIATMIAIYRARHTMVPINIKLPMDQIDFCLRDTDTVLVFCDQHLQHLVPNDMRVIVFDSDDFECWLDHGLFVPPPLDDRSVMNIKYTSGSTGRPKGVITTYGRRLWLLTRYFGRFNNRPPKQTLINPKPLYHSAGLNVVEPYLFLSGSSDSHLILMPTFDARRYITALETYGATEIKLVTAMMSMVLQEQDLLDQTNLDSVTHVCLTTSACTEKLRADIRQRFPKVKTIINPYGSSESGPIFDTVSPTGNSCPETSVGYPMSAIQSRLNADSVLEIKSPGMMTGYHNLPQVSRNSITPDGFYITGDLFRVDDQGFYYYLGRADDMFKSGGEKIYPISVEQVIEQHPAVAVSAVVPVADSIKGFKPYAFVQLKRGITVTGDEIRQSISSKLAPYEIPRQIWIVEDFPRLAIGKIDRKALQTQAVKLLALS